MDNTKALNDLPENLIERIKAFKSKLVEVELIPLEKTIDNFRRDKNPEKEISMWETIAEVYEAYVSSHVGVSLEEKIEVYKVALMASSASLEQHFAKELESLNYITPEIAADLERAINSLLKIKIGVPTNPITMAPQAKILHVDDDKYILDMFAIRFAEAGAVEETAFSAQDALAILDGGFVPDIIVTDIVMPGMDGLEFIKKLKERGINKKTTIIILSNISQSDVIEKGMSLGADGYIVCAQSTPAEAVAKVIEIHEKKKFPNQS